MEQQVKPEVVVGEANNTSPTISSENDDIDNDQPTVIKLKSQRGADREDMVVLGYN